MSSEFLSKVGQHVVGWDVGGAHLKAVLLDADGQVLDAIQLACPLWRGLSFLEQSTQSILATWSNYDFVSTVTMTGELVDLFTTREQGVCEIAKTMQALLGQDAVAFYVVDEAKTKTNCSFSGRFVNDVTERPLAAASMNWHASVTYLAHCLADAVVVDIGSTTTDIVTLQNGEAVINGITDAQRMQHHQLLYTGVVRTPLMAWGPYLKVEDTHYHLAAEYFAASADVYRLLGELSAHHDLADTADGQDKGLAATARRLARMVGCDLAQLDSSQENCFRESAELSQWKALAQGFKQQQMQLIIQAIQLNLNQLKINQLDRAQDFASIPLVALGAGQFLIENIASEMGRHFVPVQSFINATTLEKADMAALCFPAYAVARLRQLWH